MAVAATLVFAASGVGRAQDEGKPTAVDPNARAELKRMSDTLGAAKTLHFKAYALFDDIEPSGVKFKRGIIQDVTIQRPNRLHFRTTEDNGDVREGWFDGKTFTVAQPSQKIFAQIETSVDLDALLDQLQDEYGVALPTVDLLYADVAGRLDENILSGAHMGKKTLDGVQLNHLSFETIPADIQFWVEEQGVPRRLVLDFVAVEGDPEYLVMFREWDLNGSVAPKTFTFAPQPGWTKVGVEKSK